MSNNENKSELNSDKSIGYDALLEKIESSKLRLREASAEADRYKEKFELAVANAKRVEAELIDENNVLANKLSEADLTRQTLEQKCILLNDKLNIEREKFFKQEKELLEINHQNRHQAGEERRIKEQFEEKLEQERVQRRDYCCS